jgi:hypothetical protein
MGRWFWIGLWGSAGLLFVGAAIALLCGAWTFAPPTTGHAIPPPLVIIGLLVGAGWLLYSDWKAYRADTLVINDALGREVYRNTRKKP